MRRIPRYSYFPSVSAAPSSPSLPPSRAWGLMLSFAASDTPAVTPSGRPRSRKREYRYRQEDRWGHYDKFEVPNLIELQLESFPLVRREGPAGAVRRDQPDQGLHREGHGPPLPRLRVRRSEVHRRGVPDQGPDVQPAAVRQRGAGAQGSRAPGRDPQAGARLHGRLPVDDGPGHVHDQRRGARHRKPLVRSPSTTARPRTRRAGRCTAPRSSRTVVWLEFETNNVDLL